MIKRDTKAYDVNVEYGSDMVYLICVTYSIDNHSRFFAAEFYELLSRWSNRPKIDVPPGQHYTFKDEMHTFKYGVATAPDDRNEIEKWIEEKAKEAYGDACRVTVKPLDERYYFKK